MAGRLAEALDPRTALARALSSEYKPEPPDPSMVRRVPAPETSTPQSALESLKLGYELGKLAFRMRTPESSSRGGALGFLETMSRPQTYEVRPMMDATHQFRNCRTGQRVGKKTRGMMNVPETGPARLNTTTGKYEKQYDPASLAKSRKVHPTEPAGIGGAIIPALTALQVAPRVGQTWGNMTDALHGRRFRSSLTERRQGLEP